MATFNVLNYFNTTGEQYVADGAELTRKTHCTYYTDRAGDRIANNRCGLENPPGSPEPNDGSGPRGAATDASLARQQQKIVTAINGLGADVVTLEELENSVKLPGDADKGNRDDALQALVAALNADAGAGTWDYVPSPPEALGATNVTEQDTIRNGFIYKPASVEPVGRSDLLFGTTAFANAREPLAQAFKPTGADDAMTFAVVVNHFKSKGDGNPPATGDNANDPDTGAYNGDRVRQAEALVAFADRFAAARGTDKVFLTGDFNAYSQEDPITVLEEAGYTIVESDDEDDESYSFSGLSGSLDHVLANEAALDTVQGADVWEINADEAIAFQYSRYNYNVTDFWQPNLPFAASDHNPAIVGFDPAPAVDLPKQIQVLGINDFHGRILANGSEAGAAVLSGAVEDLEEQNPNTVFAAAGDLIGASTFESFILNDKPTIDALNAAGLDVSAVGNHELDQGYEDLVERVMAPYDPEDNPEGGAEWGVHLREPDDHVDRRPGGAGDLDDRA
ncbi:ExeM/NucH family extracellular endonuclease [Nocardioides sp. TF02-7]|nr:ExeM/NucH family extracellular endonuclease [Nocardioides sp. TF02-7]UMG94954.1 ExeM/NucH family extracellular endonuclease [Nocardioides sp. TF02-7]